MGRSVFCLYYLAVWVEDKRLRLSFNNEVWQRLAISVPRVYRVHSVLTIGITGSLDCVPLVHLLPFPGFSWPRWHRLLLVPLLFHCDISSGFKKVAWFSSTAVSFLGFICDSEKKIFLLLQEKRTKFAAQRKNILSQKTVSLKNLQKLVSRLSNAS